MATFLLVTPDEAKIAITGFAAANRIRFVTHARERMTQRNITYRDIRNAPTNPSTCVAGDVDRWVVTGSDLDGEATKVICVVEDDVVVITVF